MRRCIWVLMPLPAETMKTLAMGAHLLTFPYAPTHTALLSPTPLWEPCTIPGHCTANRHGPCGWSYDCSPGSKPKPLNLCRLNSQAVWSWPIVGLQTGCEPLINAPYCTHTVLAMQPTYRTATAVVDSSPRRRGAVNKWMSKGWETNLISNVLCKVRILVSTLFYFSLCLVWPSSTQMTSVNPPMPKEGVKTTPSCGLLWIIFCPVLIPPISFAYLFLSIKGIFWHITHHSTLDRSGLSGPGKYRMILINLSGVVV